MKTMDENAERSLKEFSERIGTVENSVTAFKEELITQSKPKFSTDTGFGMMEGRQMEQPAPSTILPQFQPPQQDFQQFSPSSGG